VSVVSSAALSAHAHI